MILGPTRLPAAARLVSWRLMPAVAHRPAAFSSNSTKSTTSSLCQSRGAAVILSRGGTINVTLQYNYSHDNAGAAWMICCGAGDGNVIRYNISENDNKYYKSGGVVVVSDVVFKVYNNTIWIPPVGTDPNHAQRCYGFGYSGTFPVGALIANNICYAGSPDQWGTAWYADSGAQVPPDITNVQFFQNLYNVG